MPVSSSAKARALTASQVIALAAHCWGEFVKTWIAVHPILLPSRTALCRPPLVGMWAPIHRAGMGGRIPVAAIQKRRVASLRLLLRCLASRRDDRCSSRQSRPDTESPESHRSRGCIQSRGRIRIETLPPTWRHEAYSFRPGNRESRSASQSHYPRTRLSQPAPCAQ